MALTRAQAEADIVNFLGADLLGASGLAATGSPNADLNGPLYRALLHLGYAVADPAAVADADLAQVPPALQGRFLDYARIMTVDLARIRQVGQPIRQEWPTYKVQYSDKALIDLRDRLWAEYTRYLASGAPAVGRMTPASTHALDTTRYFPPYPPFGTVPIPPDA